MIRDRDSSKRLYHDIYKNLLYQHHNQEYQYPQKQPSIDINDFNLRPYTCVVKEGQYYVTPGILENGAAFALVDLNSNETGWNYLSINTSSQYPDSIQAQAAGYIEGYLTWQSIYYGRINYFMQTYQSTDAPTNVTNWIEDNIQYMESKIQEYKDKVSFNGDEDEDEDDDAVYWYHVSLILDQISGMVEGYNDIVYNKDIARLTIVDVFILNMAGDMSDLMNAITIQAGGDIPFPKDSTEILENSHCSSFIKLADDLSEVYCGHTTWTYYTSLIRTFKYYQYSFSSQSKMISNSQLFSAYPATLSSIDDFYLLENQMIVTETTNNIYNYSLYYKVEKESVLSWIRVLVANRLSDSPLEWCQTIEKYNSGTYNNQWIVFDYRNFTPNISLEDGALYILEQIPGFCQYEDQTKILRDGYWPSYNLPFYENIYNMSGYPLLAATLNVSLQMQISYETNCRAEIFRRDANTVYTLDDFMAFMRYNNYQKDPISQGNPSYSICSRFDLIKDKPILLGGTDSKVINYKLMKEQIIVAINGPTTDNQPPFNWNNFPQFTNTTHIGMPDEYNYDWVSISKNNELECMRKDELKVIMKECSLKHNGIQRDLLINAIIQHQEQIIDLKSKLVTNNSIEKYHRGTVEYRLPTLVIYRIIRDLWQNEIDFCLNPANLRESYRWLLSIALVSKELFKLISSLFTRFQHIHANHNNTDTLDKIIVEMKDHFLNPHSILKNISHLTFSLDLLKEIADNKSIGTQTELAVVFHGVRKLILNGKKDKIKTIEIKQIKTIIRCMPNLESLLIREAIIENAKTLIQLLILTPQRKYQMSTHKIKSTTTTSSRTIVGNGGGGGGGGINNAMNVIVFGFPFVGLSVGGTVGLINNLLLPEQNSMMIAILFLLLILIPLSTWIVKQDTTILLVGLLLLAPYFAGNYIVHYLTVNHNSIFSYSFIFICLSIFAIIYLKNKKKLD
ncbi:phospholipase B-like protein [Heterostelium album PN500]|uniref:Phospholipase B-like protein n=1 Tax=Heterostelium pallidum (strain ATCC 26659 / Pp 5 / PN500) TaxID=670386 RepID=D3B7Q9_HETP5|nr:phospholipase B-like protein [Heterostelium album PN500]EFA82802.1 phospholipase B-like protein [Heterostelium album PN500]|eukprot:XP_020434919.1 phospholipase B-like protein [Heterostelium album PN500]